ncbi:MAG: DUF1828 domain-containing protein [Verrucomicrobia bacterium]|nr:DUF1828 domain-containing protein [Verrucomicrobiota bacterium]
MSFDLPLLEEQLCKTLCGEVRIRKTPQGYLQIVTPFTFTDGDTFQLYLEEAAAGGVRLTDYGHTLMHLSYENDLVKFREGTRGKLFEQVLATSGLSEEQGKLVLNSSLESLGTSVLQFGQALTRVYDITFLNRARVASTFYEDLKEALYSLVAPEKIQPNFTLPDQGEADSYPIDYRIEGKRAPLFLFGIPSRDKARLATIILEHWLRAKIDFDSLLIFQDQQEIPRLDLARLSNVGGEMVASLDASEDFHRKIIKLAA